MRKGPLPTISSRMLFCFVFFIAVSCNNANQKTGHTASHDTVSSMMNEEESHTAHSTTVSLVNGKKWKANAETITGISQMKQLVNEGRQGKIATAVLADSLQANFQEIINRCTMKGESHTQLHQYLIPLQQRINQLKDDNNIAGKLEEMQSYLNTFNNYFE